MYQLLVDFWELSVLAKIGIFFLLTSILSVGIMIFLYKNYETNAERDVFVNQRLPRYAVAGSLMVAMVLWIFFSADFNLFAANYLR